MKITDRLRLELLIREYYQTHGEDFYTELAKILDRLQREQVDDRGKPKLAIM